MKLIVICSSLIPPNQKPLAGLYSDIVAQIKPKSSVRMLDLRHGASRIPRFCETREIEISFKNREFKVGKRYSCGRSGGNDCRSFFHSTRSTPKYKH